MVLTELIQNAAQHAYREQGAAVDGGGQPIRDRLRLAVSDDGSGMPDEFDIGRASVSIVDARGVGARRNTDLRSSAPWLESGTRVRVGSLGRPFESRPSSARRGTTGRASTLTVEV